jgi:hypothetical protein
VGVPLGVALAAGPVIERGRRDSASAEPVDTVVAAADPHRLLFQPAQHLPDGHMAGGLDFRSDFRATSGRQQAHTFRIGKRQIKGRHSGVDSLVDMLARFHVRIAIELFRVPVQDHPAHPFHRHRRDLPSTGNALQLVPQPLACRQLADLNPPGGCQLPQRRLQRPGVQPGAGISPPQWRHPLRAGDRVLTCEQLPHRRLLSDPFETDARSEGAGPPARRLPLA